MSDGSGESRRFRILVNPVSGGGSAPASVAAVSAILRAAGAEVVVQTSESAEQSQAIVAEVVPGGEVIVAAGGDGMLASMAGAVVAAGGVLGIIPSGRGNDFARMLRIPAGAENVAHTLLEGEPTRVDAIDVAGRVVLGSVYSGVDSLASQLVDRARRMPSSVQYPYAAVRSLLTYRPAGFTITVDDNVVEADAYSVVIANSGYYGKGMHIAPSAVVDDGLLDVVVLPAASRWRMLRLYPKVYDGTHIEHEGVQVLRGISVSVAADRPVAAYGDGEYLGELPVTATVRPGALQVLLG